MLLDIIILVLRETIEAGVLLSLLLCISNQHNLTYRWLWSGMLIGAISASIYAANFRFVGEWFDYAGQEVVNASMQFAIYASLLLLCYLLIFSKLKDGRLLQVVLSLAIGLAITRELAEMIIFYSGFFQSDGDLVKAFTSGFIGLMIGISFGVLCYYAINVWSRPISRIIQICLLSFIAAGMSVQAIQLLIQVDWVSASKPLWSTNWLLQESSVFGQMTYAIFGYEATPTLAEVSLYLMTLGFIFVLSAIGYLASSKAERELK
ncbi:MAG: high-affinity iron transporter [Arenicella sp.]|jgi:high-affinity iron transporter